MSDIDYHLKEFERAVSKKYKALPVILDTDKVILDIGVGIGQTFIALNCTDKICIGIDPDEDAIRYGIENYGDKIQFIVSDAERILLPAESVDFVFSRVSICYTNIPKTLKEMRRVLKTGGRIWITLQGKDVVDRYIKEAVQSRSVKQLIYALYVLANGYSMKFFGFLFPFTKKRYESWQEADTMKKMLTQSGFNVHSHNTTCCYVNTIIEGRLI